MIRTLLQDDVQELLPGLEGEMGEGFPSKRQLPILSVNEEVWAANGLDIALSCIERVQKSLIRAAEYFREVDSTEGNRYLLHCIEGMERFFEAITITREVLKLDFDGISIDGFPLSRVEREFSEILNAILHCQETRDISGLADKIEYELLTNICSWIKALRNLRPSQRGDA